LIVASQRQSNPLPLDYFAWKSLARLKIVVQGQQKKTRQRGSLFYPNVGWDLESKRYHPYQHSYCIQLL